MLLKIIIIIIIIIIISTSSSRNISKWRGGGEAGRRE